MSWTIRAIRPEEIEDARTLLQANGWDGPRIGAAMFTQLVANARESVVAIDDGRVVGFARALGDGLSNGYLSMLVVADTHRKRGVGRALVEHVMGNDPDMTWVLRARGDVQTFYEKLGFRRSEVAMERVRTSPGAGPR
jgi:GNAT superfamily N-acetyltransferase